MNILQIGTVDKKGGAAAISWQLKKALEKNGHTTSLFVADKYSQEANVFTIPRKKIRRYLGFLFSIEDLYATDWILETPEFKKADLIHAHNLHGRFFNLKTLQKMSLIKPIVWTLHDEWAITPHCAYTYETQKIKDGFFQCNNKQSPPRLLWNNEKYLSWRKKSLYDQTKLTIITPSLWLKNRVEKSILKNQKNKLIYNGIDIQIFKPCDCFQTRKKLNLPVDKKIILFLADGGKSNPFKGWEFVEKVIEFYQNRNDLLFLCVGNSDQTILNNNTKVSFISRIENQEILAQYYSAADFLLHSSTADNFPLVILEAMACGLPIVAFSVGGVTEAVKHLENGYIARYKDLESLIQGVEYLLKLDLEAKKTITLKSSTKIKQFFSLEKMIEKYFDLYQTEIKTWKKN